MSFRDKLSAEVLERLSKPELRAVAHDRGYKVGDGGKGTLITRILDAQDEDRLVRGEAGELVESSAVTEELDRYTKDTPGELGREGAGEGRQPSTLNPPSPVRENPLQREPSSAPAPTSVPTSSSPSPAKAVVPPKTADLVITPSTAKPVELGRPMPDSPALTPVRVVE